MPAGGVADHLRDGRNGMACKEGDIEGMAQAMVTLATEWEFRQHLARGARRTAEGLSWETELDRLDLSTGRCAPARFRPRRGTSR